jgi:hypothetical protein
MAVSLSLWRGKHSGGFFFGDPVPLPVAIGWKCHYLPQGTVILFMSPKKKLGMTGDCVEPIDFPPIIFVETSAEDDVWLGQDTAEESSRRQDRREFLNDHPSEEWNNVECHHYVLRSDQVRIQLVKLEVLYVKKESYQHDSQVGLSYNCPTGRE